MCGLGPGLGGGSLTARGWLAGRRSAVAADALALSADSLGGHPGSAGSRGLSKACGKDGAGDSGTDCGSFPGGAASPSAGCVPWRPQLPDVPVRSGLALPGAPQGLTPVATRRRGQRLRRQRAGRRGACRRRSPPAQQTPAGAFDGAGGQCTRRRFDGLRGRSGHPMAPRAPRHASGVVQSVEESLISGLGHKPRPPAEFHRGARQGSSNR